MFFSILLLSLSATVCLAGMGSCPTPAVMNHFELEKLNGTWYEIESTAGAEMFPRTCSKYVTQSTGKFKASLLHKYASFIAGNAKSELWQLTTPKSSQPAKLQMEPVKGKASGNKKPVWILDTDYKNYALVYSCLSRVVSHTEEISILARTKNVHDNEMKKYHDILKKKNVNQESLKRIDQHKHCKE